ncbi:NADH-ubiquinone oxidoreductase-F iron-sulfur binding region domain-containing protein [Actinomarinicola tropica]|uniref:NADH-ubiquinone oxidoreductase 51kDa subunit iron-sulphur binding domain-containing protein n=1 Tax=Actinomarinicola tropica TaxID=2789776 RepID=A0A5Q2RI58_9ACTN|nr:NADH-ubiquinone oxidoreductase-F iron-sulfur binding region domain-containing protein [Actinomarinicola tropica]QGG94251.1 hypothetical protein GH723_03565 [Actinomarinicola tropica]
MAAVTRVLDPEPVTSLEAYVERGGGAGLEAALRMGGLAVIEELDAAGLRGRGGAGFPTGTKWRTVVENRDPTVAVTVVVNAAEGEPGSFKDRMLLRRNPYRVLEGALIAASVVDADRVVVATKASFTGERDAMEAAMREVEAAGWAPDMALSVVGGPGEYLFGEETALLEVLAGRGPFPRVAPPYRRGIDPTDDTSAEAELTGPSGPGTGDPALVNNAETMAHVAMILAEGPDWFREVGTADSPGTVVCTISGDVERSGVVEVAMGTPLSEVIALVAGDPRKGRRWSAALSGVASSVLPAELFATPLTYEDMAAAGSGLGAAGFIVLDDGTDLVALAEGVSRFLSIESCGQCLPCKLDGTTITRLLERVRTGRADETALLALDDRLNTVTRGARCTLAEQHQRVVTSALELFPDQVQRALDRDPDDEEGRVDPYFIAPIVDIVDGEAILDDAHARKQPDWSFDAVDSGQLPVDRIRVARSGS